MRIKFKKDENGEMLTYRRNNKTLSKLGVSFEERLVTEIFSDVETKGMFHCLKENTPSKMFYTIVPMFIGDRNASVVECFYLTNCGARILTPFGEFPVDEDTILYTSRQEAEYVLDKVENKLSDDIYSICKSLFE